MLLQRTTKFQNSSLFLLFIYSVQIVYSASGRMKPFSFTILKQRKKINKTIYKYYNNNTEKKDSISLLTDVDFYGFINI